MYTVDAHEREAVDGTAQLLSIEGGKQITFGMSGGPVLSLESGAVTAVTRVSKDPKGILGGSAVPISRGAAALDTVAALLKQPERSIIGWRNVLGRERWQQLGRVWDMRARMDLTLGGALNRWSVQTDAPGADKQFITGSDLGEEITEAMFRWAQRRRATLDEEVALLGRLLARALLPAPIVAELGRLSQEDQVLIRLHFEPASGLADVPWELSALPREADRSGSSEIKYLAADERFRFVRVAEGGSLEPAPSPSPSPSTCWVSWACRRNGSSRRPTATTVSTSPRRSTASVTGSVTTSPPSRPLWCRTCWARRAMTRPNRRS